MLYIFQLNLLIDFLRVRVRLSHPHPHPQDISFRTLVDELENFQYVENYCIILSQGKSSDNRKIVAHMVFEVFCSSLNISEILFF